MVSDADRIKQIRDDMQAIADRHALEFIYRQGVDGQILMQVGVTLTPTKPAAPQEPPPATPDE